MSRHLALQLAQAPIIWPALRVMLWRWAAASTALGLRHGGGNFLTRLGQSIFAAPKTFVHAIDRLVSHGEKGAAEDALQQQPPVAGFYAKLATLIGFSVFTIRYLAEHMLQSLQVLRNHVVPSVVEGRVRPIERKAGRARAAARSTHRDAAIGDAAIGRKIDTVKGGLAAAIGAVAGGVRALDREIGAFHIPRLWHRVNRLEKVLTAAGAMALVLAGLRRAGCGWGCSRTGKGFGRWLHRLPRHWLNDLLALAADFFVLKNICHVLPWLESAFAEIATPFVRVVSKAGTAACSDGLTDALPLDVPALHLPSDPSLALYLP